MNEDELLYAFNKQIANATHLCTIYGDLHLDDEMREAVEDALILILERRLKEAAK